MQASGQNAAELCWSTLANGTLFWESWGEQHAVFDSLSGETHLLPDSTARLLRKLDGHSCSARQLAEMICTEAGVSCDEAFVMDITRLLQQLQSAGLVEKSAW
ncbi:MAG: HPr-rel-A system PqqD family peptide chaperone [Gammaproteobacteria bacterium]|jgi:PqqD family protein of HPr-rel-A system